MRTSTKTLVTLSLAAGLALAAAAPASAAAPANCHGTVISAGANGSLGVKLTPAAAARLASELTSTKVTAGDYNKAVKVVCAAAVE